MATRFVIVRRAGRHAIVRVLPSGEAAGYDPVADREQHQRHFQIHRDWPDATAIDKAFGDSRKYLTLDDAVIAASEAGREIEIL
jgi:hypothetical protein